MSKKRLQEEDVAELYDLVSRQLREDRDSINAIFEELKGFVKGSMTNYVDLGEVLAKMSELKMKQTAQVIDVFKTVEKALPDDEMGGFSQEDLDFIAKQTEKDKKDDGSEER